jgi:pimeloyl-ACP methyl ester carboxylesterase
MGRGQEADSPARRFAAAEALPKGRIVPVRSKDGIRLHTEVFGPEDGYPIVLAHGITCALRVWAYQIADLSTDYRVIAFDHRGHGKSAVPPRHNYSLDFLAADLDAVLETTLAPGERAVIAGHSMGGIAITSWAERYPERVPQRADAVALINTTTGDLLRNVKFLPVPAPLADARVRAAGTLLKTFGAAPLLRAVDRPSRRFVSATPTRRSPSSSTSCSPRHRPQAAAAGPAHSLTRSVPSTSDWPTSRCRLLWSAARKTGCCRWFRRATSPRWRRTYPRSSSCRAGIARSSSARMRSTSTCGC